MHPFPHTYAASAAGTASGTVSLASPGLSNLDSAAPAEFGGPGDLWSPETMLCAALADCFVLTFRAVARAARLEWQRLECKTEGILDRVDGVSRFTRYTTFATLTVPAGTDAAKARQLLEKAEHGCLIANSVTGERELVIQIALGESQAAEIRAA
jgi:peroxiredoxin-like protein